MPTLEQYRAPVLAQVGGFQSGTVDLDPDINDQDAARSLVTALLFDREKTSDAFGGQYLWIPRYSDNRRVETRGYSIKYVAVFEPPSDGSYTLSFFGFGETRPIYAGASAATVQRAINALDTEDMALVTVDKSSDGLLNIRLPFEVGVGSSSGRLLAQGGLAVLLASQGYSQPLVRGVRWHLSPKLPFGSADGVTGINDCINLALDDILVPRLLPVTATLAPTSRARVFNPRELAPWLTRDLITNYYGPTDWALTATFVPPTSGTYRLAVQSYKTLGPIATPLAASATGAQIQAALLAVGGLTGLTVSPQGAASSYQIVWTTRYYNPKLVPSGGGYVASQQVEKLRDPYPLLVRPYYHADAEVPTVTDPGLPEGQTWFIETNGPSSGRIAPQSYPLKANGQPDTQAEPILGTTWVESASGLVNDLDQALPPLHLVTDRAIRYVLAAIEDASPQGEAGPWAVAGKLAAAQAAARSIYGPQRHRPANVRRYIGAGVVKGSDFWLP